MKTKIIFLLIFLLCLPINAWANVVEQNTLSVWPQVLTFSVVAGQSPVNQVVAVTNSGGNDSIAWQATPFGAFPWLNLIPTNGQTPGTITVAVDPAEADYGTQTAQFIVSADVPVTVTVNLTVEPPVLQTTPDRIAMEFMAGESYLPAQVHITQANLPGGQAIHWVAGALPVAGADLSTVEAVTTTGVRRRDRSLVSAPAWVQLSPAEGRTPAVMFVHIDAAAAGYGEHRATIIIDGGQGCVDRLHAVDLTVHIFRTRHYLPLVITP